MNTLKDTHRATLTNIINTNTTPNSNHNNILPHKYPTGITSMGTTIPTLNNNKPTLVIPLVIPMGMGTYNSSPMGIMIIVMGYTRVPKTVPPVH